MKAKGWFASALVAGGVLFAIKTTGGCLNSTAPDQKLASQIADLCDIAREGATEPVQGVRVLGKYLVKHGGDLAENFVETIATIEKIADDDAHDERARLAHERLVAVACPADWQRFDRAIERNAEAKALVEQTAVRLNRTLEILFGGRVDLLDLPHRLQSLAD